MHTLFRSFSYSQITYGSRKLYASLKNVCQKCLRGACDENLFCCSQGYSFPSSSIPDRENVPCLQTRTRFPAEHMNLSQHRIIEVTEEVSCVFVHVHEEQLCTLHVLPSFPMGYLTEYCNINFISMICCLTLIFTRMVLEQHSQKLLLKTKSAPRDCSRGKQLTNPDNLL